MGFFHEYPYTDFHEINLDWILQEIMKLHKDWDEFTAVNKITNAGAWDITKQYPAWTIVSYNNAGYISLQPVPAGVAITDTYHWGLIADYDVFISDLAGRVAVLEGQMTGVLSDVSDLKDDVMNLNRKGTIVIFGDSWVANSPSVIAPYIANHYGCTVKSYAHGGTGFNVPNGYKEQLDEMANDQTLDLDDVRFSIIVCGLNDHSINPSPRRSFTPAEFAQAFNEWKAIYNQKFANHPLPPVYWFHNYSLENWLTYPEDVVNPTTYYPQYAYYRTVRRNIREIRSCNCFGFVEGSSDCWQTENWRHLTEAGSTQYAENMCCVIDGAKPRIYDYQVLTGNLPSSFTYREVPTVFKIAPNEELLCEFSIPMASIANIDTNGSNITFDQFIPARPALSRHWGFGVNINAYNHDNMTVLLKSVAPSLTSMLSVSNGRAVYSVATDQ